MDNQTKRNLLAYTILRSFLHDVSDQQMISFDTKDFYDSNGNSLSSGWSRNDKTNFKAAQFLIELVVPLNSFFTMESLLPRPGLLEPCYSELDSTIAKINFDLMVMSNQMNLLYSVDDLFENVPCESISFKFKQEYDEEGESHHRVEVSVELEPNSEERIKVLEIDPQEYASSAVQVDPEWFGSRSDLTVTRSNLNGFFQTNDTSMKIVNSVHIMIDNPSIYMEIKDPASKSVITDDSIPCLN